MWAEACAMIERAEQLHRQFFQPGVAAVSRASWEPPVDIFESERDVLIVVARLRRRRQPPRARDEQAVASSVASPCRRRAGSSADRRW
jgi:hypothetical protein